MANSENYFMKFYTEENRFSKKAIKTLFRLAAKCRRNPFIRRSIHPHVLSEEGRHSIQLNDTYSECHQLDEKLVMKDLDIVIIWKNLDRYEEVVNPALGDHVFEWSAGDIGGDGAQDQFGIKYSYRSGWAGNREFWCIKEGNLAKRRCEAKRKRITDRIDGPVTILLPMFLKWIFL